nr:cytokinesis protein [Naematelia aurantialba]
MAALTLSNYQLGDLLGRGASGSVYRALNFLTGETVAIKSVSLLSLAPSALPDIMSEIDLLKNLNHPNIVKYKGFARDKENLFIVLEYCENGSLQSILKKFGKFPESLVAVYISQVLEGLIYLHDQGVIHRDIKGANILTNKDGSVKLADFGVSSRTAGPQLEDNDNEVVGSPYWMAPEVIEQSGASTASDIWSVGCVVVELLEGRPPYGDLAPMQALWRIVQDESMKLPDGASPIVRDFLYQCFQKDPNLRVSAKKLLRHPWMMSARKHLAVGPAPIALPTSQPVSPVKTKSGSTRNATSNGGARVDKPVTVYDEAVQRVQQWNEALNASPRPLGTVRRLPTTTQARQPSAAYLATKKMDSKPASMPSLPSNESLAAQPSTSATPSPVHIPSGGLVQKSQHVNQVLNRAKEQSDEESWDDDFASDISLSKLKHQKEETSASEEPDQKTLRPTKSPIVSNRPLPAVAGKSTSKARFEDYSDDILADATGLENKLADLKLKNKTRRGILHPNDLRKLSTTTAPAPIPPIPVRSLSAPNKTSPAIPPVSSSASLGPPRSPRPPIRSPPGSRQNSLRNKAELTESQRGLQKYTETENEDYSDMFDAEGDPTTLGARSTSSLQLTRRTNRSWDESENDQQDPFAEIDDDYVGDAEDLEANLLRDKKATLCANVGKNVDLLVPGSSSEALVKACDELLAMMDNAPDMGLESHFVSCRGMMAILEVLESRLSREVAVRLLRIVNSIVATDLDMLESFCLIGGIPVILPFTSKKHSLETRLEASAFVQHLTRSASTLQMFVSCRGLRILVELLDEDYEVNKAFILASLEGISSVFDLQSPTPRNDFCRMFVREGILGPLSTALLSILQDKDVDRDDTDEAPSHSHRAITTLLLFCQVAQADARVREAFASRTIMIRILKACDSLPRKLLVIAIKAIKHLSTSPQLIEVLQNSNAMEVLVGLLGRYVKGSHANEICSHLFQTIYSMTRLSKARQEEAASFGIIPLLKRVIQNKSPLKQFALPILCDLANAGKVARRLLWQNDGMTLYLDLLQDPYWRVSALDAVLSWMSDETARVEDVLLENSATDSIVQCFVQSSGVSFEGILDPLLKILRLSTSLTSSISTTPFFRRLADSLQHPSKPLLKLNLLRLTRLVCDNHPDRATLVSRFSLASIVDQLAKQDEAILVRELAKEIYPSLLFGNDPPVDIGESALAKKVSSTMRRTTSEHVISHPTPLSLSHPYPHDQTRDQPRDQTRDRSHAGSGPGFSSEQPSHVRAKARESRVGAAGGADGLGPAGSAGLGLGLGLGLARPSSTPGTQPLKKDDGERPKHKRKISRNQLKDVQWQTDENGRLKTVRSKGSS